MKNKVLIIFFFCILFVLGGCSNYAVYRHEEITQVSEAAEIDEVLMEPSKSNVQLTEQPEAAEKDGRSMTIICGYNRWVKAGRNIRILTYFSNEGEDFQGNLYVSVPNYNAANAAYKTSFTAKTGETVRIELAVPIYGGMTEVVLDVRDEKEREILYKAVPLEVAYYTDSAYVGVLSEDTDFLNYVRGNEVKAFLIEPEDFPENKMCLDSLDCLVLHDFDIGNLNEKQQKVLETFKAEGNVQVIEEEGYEGLSERIVNGLSDEKKKIIEQEYYGEKQYYQAFTSVDAIDIKSIPQVGKYAVILFIYLLVIGPPVYVILKKMNRQGGMWLVVMVMSSLFTLIVYGIGGKTRLTEPSIGYLAISDIEENAVREEVLFSLSSPYNDNYRIDLPEEYNVAAMERVGGFMNGNISFYQQNRLESRISTEEYRTVVALEEGNTSIQIKNTAAFSNGHFLGEITREAKTGEKMSGTEGEVTITSDYRAEGMVANRTGYDLSNAILCVGDIYVNIGNLKKDQSVTIDDLPQISAATPEILYQKKFLESAAGGIPYGINREERVSRIYNAYDYLMNLRWNTFYNKEGMLIGVDENNYSGELFSKVELKTSGIHVVTAKVMENFTSDGETFIQNLDKYTVMEDQKADRYRYINNENQQVKIQFAPEDIIKELIYSEELNSEFMDNVYSGFYGSMKAFNFETGKYDIIFESGKAGSLTVIEPYLDEENQMILLYDITERKEKERAVTAPVLSAITATVTAAIKEAD